MSIWSRLFRAKVNEFTRQVQISNPPAADKTTKAQGELVDTRYMENEIQPVIERLKSKDMDVRGTAYSQLERLAQAGDKRLILPLIEVLHHGSNATRERAAQLLGLIDDDRAFDALLAALEDIHWGVRHCVIQSLGNIGNERAIGPIKKCVVKARPEEERVRGCGMNVLREKFHVDNRVLKDIFLKSNASADAKKSLL